MGPNWVSFGLGGLNWAVAPGWLAQMVTAFGPKWASQIRPQPIWVDKSGKWAAQLGPHASIPLRTHFGPNYECLLGPMNMSSWPQLGFIRLRWAELGCCSRWACPDGNRMGPKWASPIGLQPIWVDKSGVAPSGQPNLGHASSPLRTHLGLNYECLLGNTYILILAAWHGGSKFFFLRRPNFDKMAQISMAKKVPPAPPVSAVPENLLACTY